MIYHVHDDPHYFYESGFVVSEIVGGKSPADVKEELLAKRHGDRDKLNALFDPVQEIQDAIAAEVDQDDECLRLLFSSYESLPDPLWMILAEAHLSGSHDAATIGVALKSYLEDMEAAPEPMDERAVADYILSRDISYHAQSKLLLLLLRREELFAKMLELLGRIEARLREISPAVKAITGPATARLRAELGEIGLSGLLKSKEIPVILDEGNVYEIYPHLFPSSVLRLYTHQERENLFFFWGVNAFAVDDIRRESMFTMEQVLEVLKALSDKTKLEMLAILSREELYGSQLADRTGLTTATISYHIRQLTTLRLLHVVKKENRIYYRTDKPRLNDYLAECTRILTGGSA